MRNTLYYLLKPFLPYPLRLKIRRCYTRAKRKRAGNAWPILHGSEKPPGGWPGWPDGKQFAVILTHDVEGQLGLENCHQLMALEDRRGFASSFNFVPEGSYGAAAEARKTLFANGFEVAVHDLHHDGKLLASQSQFRRNALRINHYLEDWGAVGFRAGFMLHNLDWFHALNIEYDASTFDTDPFEPQPDGMGTIFPFWVPRPDNTAGGYVELPYTLVQDSTLFLLLREHNSDIWLKKLDWIATKGGMVLVNTHPDYMIMHGGRQNMRQYPVALYERLLEYLVSRYANAYWHGLPREVARFVQSSRSGHPQRAGMRAAGDWPVSLDHCVRSESASRPQQSNLLGKRAAVVVFADYLSDARPRRAAEALAGIGMQVEVISLKENRHDSIRDKANGVAILRLPITHWRGGKLGYILHYGIFTLISMVVLAFRSLFNRYSLVHVHNMPDVLVFAALVPKMLGSRVILDLHDPMPELMMSIFGFQRNSFYVKLLARLEKWSIRFADLALTPNASFQKLFASRSCPASKLHVVLNSPDESIFAYREIAEGFAIGRSNSKPFVIMYHGALVERHGLDLAVRALAKVKRSIPQAELHIYGVRTPFFDRVLELARQCGVENSVHYHGAKSLLQIAQILDDCDVGIIPNRQSIFTELNFPTRIFEYLARGKPVIGPLTAGISDYFGHDELLFFEMGNADDLSKKIEFVFAHPPEVSAVVKRGQAIYRKYTWAKERLRLCALIGALLEQDGVTPQASSGTAQVPTHN